MAATRKGTIKPQLDWVKLLSINSVKESCCIINPSVPPIPVMTKIGAATEMPLWTKSFTRIAVWLSKRKESNTPIPKAKVGVQMTVSISLKNKSGVENGIKERKVPIAIKIMGAIIGAIALENEGSTFCSSSWLSIEEVG